MRMLQLLLAICFLLSLGCTSSKVISTGLDTYMVTASGAGFSTAGVREKVYKKANTFCESHGLVMVPVSFNAKQGKLGSHPPNADLVFQALKPGDSAIERPRISEADEQIETRHDVHITTHDNSNQKQDVYGELLKLNDLKQKGILSEAEFEDEKQKLLKQ